MPDLGQQTPPVLEETKEALLRHPQELQKVGISVEMAKGLFKQLSVSGLDGQVLPCFKRYCQDFRFLLQDPRTLEGFRKGFRRGL